MLNFFRKKLMEGKEFIQWLKEIEKIRKGSRSGICTENAG